MVQKMFFSPLGTSVPWVPKKNPVENFHVYSNIVASILDFNPTFTSQDGLRHVHNSKHSFLSSQPSNSHVPYPTDRFLHLAKVACRPSSVRFCFFYALAKPLQARPNIQQLMRAKDVSTIRNPRSRESSLPSTMCPHCRGI